MKKNVLLGLTILTSILLTGCNRTTKKKKKTSSESISESSSVSPSPVSSSSESFSDSSSESSTLSTSEFDAEITENEFLEIGFNNTFKNNPNNTARMEANLSKTKNSLVQHWHGSASYYKINKKWNLDEENVDGYYKQNIDPSNYFFFKMDQYNYFYNKLLNTYGEFDEIHFLALDTYRMVMEKKNFTYSLINYDSFSCTIEWDEYSQMLSYNESYVIDENGEKTSIRETVEFIYSNDAYDEIFAFEDENRSFYPVGEFDGWNPSPKYCMKPASMNMIKRYSTQLYNNLIGRYDHIKYMYVCTDVPIGTNDPGWECRALVDGVVKTFPGSAALKVMDAELIDDDPNDSTYNCYTWIPDPNMANAEALTDNVFIPAWQDEPDEYGFSWSHNPVVTDIGDTGGYYTIIVVQYDYESTPTTPGYGIAAINTGDYYG